MSAVREELLKAGVELRVDSGRLLARSRLGEKIPAALLTLIREHRDELIQELTCPRLDLAGRLIIPFGAPRKYHWWKAGGQSAEETRAELLRKRQESESKSRLIS
jgi:hypothetical protein